MSKTSRLKEPIVINHDLDEGEKDNRASKDTNNPDVIRSWLSKRFKNSRFDPKYHHQLYAIFIGCYTKCFNCLWKYADNEALAKVNPEKEVKPPQEDEHGFSAYWLGHATFLLRMNGFNILTDPIFDSIMVGPERKADKREPAFEGEGVNVGCCKPYPRRTKVPIMPKNLPRIDFVTISHKHRDHFDEPSLRVIAKRWPHARVCAPEGTQEDLERFGFRPGNIHPALWWHQFMHKGRGKADMRLTMVPACHWSSVKAHDVNKAFWGGWVFTQKDGLEDKVVYFSGDTSADYLDMFRHIHDEFPSIDAGLMAVGPCIPQCAMRGSHASGKELLKIVKILEPKQMFATHHSTFALGRDRMLEPRERWISAAGNRATDMVWLKLGVKFNLLKAPGAADRTDYGLKDVPGSSG